MNNIFLIDETNFSRTWAKAVNKVLNSRELSLGNDTKQNKIKDSVALIKLHGNAINQILNKELHPDFPFKSIDEYCKTFTIEYLEEYENKSDDEKFSYLYIDRLAQYKVEFPSVKTMRQKYVDQLKIMYILLWKQRNKNYTSNKTQAITWYPHQDMDAFKPKCEINPGHAPCLQRIQIRYLGNDNVQIQLDWRSRDCFNAFQANIIALVNMLNDMVILPNKCTIEEVIDFSSSLHIYESDWEQAKNIRQIPDYI